MKRLTLLLAILIVAGCAPQPERSVTAAQNLNSAAAQATNAAIDDAAIARATQRAQEDRNAEIARATNAAYDATAAAVSATRAANDATIAALSVAQQSNNATTTAKQNQAAVAISINAATATAQAIDRQARLEADDAQRKSAEARATSTAIAKASEDDAKASFTKQDMELTFWVGWLFKIGLGLMVLIGIYTIIELIRKRASVMHVGNYTVAVDGGAVGSMQAYLLMPEQPKPLMIAAPPAEVVQHNGNGTHAVMVNGSPVDSMSQEEYDERQYWRTRAMRFLQSAMQVSGPDSNRIPRYDRIGCKAADWVETTDAIGQWIDKQERQPTFCLPPYETLTKLYDAIATRKIAPLPPFIRAKYAGNSGKQETEEQRKTDETGSKTAGNSPVSLLDQAIANLPGVDR